MNTPRLSRSWTTLRIRFFGWLLGKPQKCQKLELVISQLVHSKREIEAESLERKGWVYELTLENKELKGTVDGLQGNIEILEGQLQLYAQWEQRESARLDADTARHTNEAMPPPRRSEYLS